MNKKDCKIVQDLLPNFIDKLTSEDTNKFIENHLNECDECKKILNNMQTNLKLDEDKKQGKTINFIKKYNKKLKVLKLILFLIALIILISIARNAIIITMISNKGNISKNKTNYFLTLDVYNNGSVSSIYTQVIDEKYVREIEFKNNRTDIIEKKAEYSNGDASNYYIKKSDEEKIAILNYEKDGVLNLNLEDWCFSDNKNFIRNVLKTSIKEVNYSRRKCYYFSNILISGIGVCNVYVDKETGIIRRIHIAKNEDTEFISNVGMILDETIIDISYSLDNVKPEIAFKEPDISEYKIMTIEEYLPIK